MRGRTRLMLLALGSTALACMSTVPMTSAPRLPTAFVVTVSGVSPPTASMRAMSPTPNVQPALPPATRPATKSVMRVHISTSSDWTNLTILNSEVVPEATITSTDGVFTNHTAAPELIAMNQTLESAEAGKTITLQVKLQVDATSGADKLDMILQKGDIGVATLRFYRESDAGDVLVRELTHDFPAGGPTGLNELAFSVPLK